MRSLPSPLFVRPLAAPLEMAEMSNPGIKEMVKTIVLRQDPPLCKKTGGLFMCPPSPTLKDGVLLE